MSIESMIEATIGKEGDYVDHPDDRGGPTRWGITQAVARKYGYTGDMKWLERETAKAIYRQKYAIDPGFAKVAELSSVIAEELFDTGVNMGPSVPSLWLQEWLNVFNQQSKLYADIKEDGDIGPGTLKALGDFLKARGKEGEQILLTALNCSQGDRYKDLARARQSQESFVYGWLRARVAM
jgi:lysozyme family protein